MSVTFLATGLVAGAAFMSFATLVADGAAETFFAAVFPVVFVMGLSAVFSADLVVGFFVDVFFAAGFSAALLATALTLVLLDAVFAATFFGAVWLAGLIAGFGVDEVSAFVLAVAVFLAAGLVVLFAVVAIMIS